MTRWLVAALVLGAAFVALRLVVPRLGASVAGGPSAGGERRLADCPGSPNCRGSDASREDRRVAPLPLHGTVEETMTALVALVEDRDGARVVRRDADYLHATFSSPIMGYVDDVEFLVDEASGTVRLRSASRLGRSDLGANARRVEALRAAWEGRTGGTGA